MRLGRPSHSLIVVALTEVPQAGLVEVMEADATRDGVDELSVLDGGRNDVGKRQPEEINFAEYLALFSLAELDLIMYGQPGVHIRSGQVELTSMRNIQERR